MLDPLTARRTSRPLPWFAMSICVVDGELPRVAVVHVTLPVCRDAIAGGGAGRRAIARRAPVPLDEAIVAINALPSRNPGWGQFRCFGAAALDLCVVADGRFDAYVDLDVDALGPWDYLGGMLICQESGVEVADVPDRLVTLDHAARRILVAGGRSVRRCSPLAGRVLSMNEHGGAAALRQERSVLRSTARATASLDHTCGESQLDGWCCAIEWDGRWPRSAVYARLDTAGWPDRPW